MTQSRHWDKLMLMELPFQPYSGDDPFLFVSYAHEDAKNAYPEIAWLNNQGTNIWYDQRIEVGATWQDAIAEKISQCHLFLAFLSPAFVASPACVNEVHYSMGQGNPFIGVYLQPVELPPGIDLAVGNRQTISRDPDASWRSRLLDGISEHVQHHIRTLRDQAVVFVDLRGFGKFQERENLADVEAVLMQYDILTRDISNRFGGTIRSFGGDECCLTFPEPDRALNAIAELAKSWQVFIEKSRYDLSLAAGISYGDFMMFRSFVFGSDPAFRLSDRVRRERQSGSRILVSPRVTHVAHEALLIELPNHPDLEPAFELDWKNS